MCWSALSFVSPFSSCSPDLKGQLLSAALGGLAVGGGLLLVVLLYEKLRRVDEPWAAISPRERRLLLLFLTGLYLGWLENLLCLLLACLLGIVFGLATQKRRAARENAQLIPWGPLSPPPPFSPCSLATPSPPPTSPSSEGAPPWLSLWESCHHR